MLTDKQMHRLTTVHSVSAVLNLGAWPHQNGYPVRHFVVELQPQSKNVTSTLQTLNSSKWTEVHNAPFPAVRFVPLEKLRPQTTYKVKITSSSGVRKWSSQFSFTTSSLEDEFKGKIGTQS